MKKLVIITAGLALIAFILAHIFVDARGKAALEKKLRAVFLSDVSIGKVTTKFPFGLVVKDLEVKNWFKVKRIVSGNGMIDVFKGDAIISDLRLEGMEFDLEKRKHGPDQKPPVNLEAVAGSGSAALFVPRHIVIKRLTVSGGTLVYTDFTKGETPIKISVKDLDFRMENFQWPVTGSEVTAFKLSGRVPWENIREEGRIDFSGWVNLYKKDMRAKLEIKNIDGVYIYPYYSSWVNIDKARVEKARFDFTGDITSLNNEVNAPCHLELTQIVFKPKQDQEKEQRIEKITNVVLGLLKAMDNGRIVLNFNLKTKLDDPEFGLGVIQQALRDKMYEARKSRDSGPMQIIKFPGKIIEGTINSATDLTKSVINGTVVVGKELKKAVETSFSRENNPVDEEPGDAVDAADPGIANSTVANPAASAGAAK